MDEAHIDTPAPASDSDVREVGVVLSRIILALDSAVLKVHGTAQAIDFPVTSVALLEPEELLSESVVANDTDMVLPVGADESVLLEWLRHIQAGPSGRRLRAAVVRSTVVSARLRHSADSSSVVIIEIDSRVRWDVVLNLVQRCLAREQWRPLRSDAAGAGPNVDDLFELAALVADGTGGMVTIEDATERQVLAYSPSDESADDLRMHTILGREPSSEAMQVLRQRGVIGAIRSSREVVSVAEDSDIGMRPRLAAGIHGPGGLFLGSIWVQQGCSDFLPDADRVVRGAAVTAARILLHSLGTPSTTELTLHRVLGEGERLDPIAAAGYLGVPVDSTAVLIGISAQPHDDSTVPTLSKLLLLHARAFSPEAVVAVIGGRGYILFTSARVVDLNHLFPWIEQLVQRLEAQPGASRTHLRAAVASPIDGLQAIAGARREVDLVLKSTNGQLPRVTSLARSRTAVLLSQAMDVMAAREDLSDPRLLSLIAYDADHGTGLVASIQAYLDHGSNARGAARALNIHPNTLHYRLGRAQNLSGLNLDDPDDRLLTALQLAIRERTPRSW